jgi:hypothetical protein
MPKLVQKRHAWKYLPALSKTCVFVSKFIKKHKFNVLQFYGVYLQNKMKKTSRDDKILKVFATVCEIVLQYITTWDFSKVSHVVF